MSVNEKMTAIARAIREKTGGTAPLTLDGMAEAIEDVYQAGVTAEYDRFWDAYQENGKKTDYRFAFAGPSWTDETFKPKYPFPTFSVTGYMFSFSGISTIEHDLDMSAINNAAQIFTGCSKLKRIKSIRFKEDATAVTNPFASCTSLSDITINGRVGFSISFSGCPLTYTSLASIINSLTDFSGTSVSRTLTLGTENIAKLSQSDIATITQKGWSLA